MSLAQIVVLLQAVLALLSNPTTANTPQVQSLAQQAMLAATQALENQTTTVMAQGSSTSTFQGTQAQASDAQSVAPSNPQPATPPIPVVSSSSTSATSSTPSQKAITANSAPSNLSMEININFGPSPITSATPEAFPSSSCLSADINISPQAGKTEIIVSTEVENGGTLSADGVNIGGNLSESIDGATVFTRSIVANTYNPLPFYFTTLPLATGAHTVALVYSQPGCSTATYNASFWVDASPYHLDGLAYSALSTSTSSSQ